MTQSFLIVLPSDFHPPACSSQQCLWQAGRQASDLPSAAVLAAGSSLLLAGLTVSVLLCQASS